MMCLGDTLVYETGGVNTANLLVMAIGLGIHNHDASRHPSQTAYFSLAFIPPMRICITCVCFLRSIRTM